MKKISFVAAVMMLIMALCSCGSGAGNEGTSGKCDNNKVTPPMLIIAQEALLLILRIVSMLRGRVYLSCVRC